MRLPSLTWAALLLALFLCTPSVLSENDIPSDITIGLLGALVDTSNSNTAVGGEPAAFATSLAVRLINESPDVLPNTTLHAVYNTTNSYEQTAIFATLWQADYGVSAIVGEFNSRISRVCAYVANEYTIPMLSYGSTSPIFSDKATYEYFSRTVPPDTQQGMYLADLVHHFEWEKVAVLHTSDDYATPLADAFIERAGTLDVDVRTTQSFAVEGDVTTAVQRVLDTGTNIIFLSMVTGDARNILAYVAEHVSGDSGIVWLGCDGWLNEQVYEDESGNVDEDLFRVVKGAVGTLPAVAASSQEYIDADALWRASPPDPRFATVNPSDGMNTWGAFAYDAVWLFALSMDEMIREGLDPVVRSDILLDRIRTVTFNSTTGYVVLDEVGDRIGIYDVFNYADEGMTAVGTIGTSPAGDVVFEQSQDIVWPDGSTTPVVPQDLPVECKEGQYVNRYGVCANGTEPLEYVYVTMLFPLFFELRDGTTVFYDDAIQLYHAAMIAVERINNKTDGYHDDILPETDIAFTSRDTHGDPSMIPPMSELVNAFGTDIDVAVILGSYFSKTSVEVQYSIPSEVLQLSYGATAAALSNTDRYTNFFRSCPSDDARAYALATILKEKFEWTRVSILKATSDLYSASFASTFSGYAEEAEMVVVQNLGYETVDATPALLQQVKDAGSRVVLIAALSDEVAYILARAAELDMIEGYTYVCSEIPTFGDITQEEIGGADVDVMFGTVLTLLIRVPTGLLYQDLEATLKAVPTSCVGEIGVECSSCDETLDITGESIWIWDHDRNTTTPDVCVGPTSSGEIVSPAFVAYIYDAVLSIAVAVQHMYENDIVDFSRADLMDAMKSIEFDGPSGTVDYLSNPEGDRRETSFELNTYFSEVDVRVVAEWDSGNVTTLCDLADPTCVHYSSTDGTKTNDGCDGDHYLDADSVCLPCPAGMHTLSSHMTHCTSCGDEICPQDYCQSGSYYNGEECDLCPVGHYTSQDAQTECQPCPAGTYAQQLGSYECTPCSKSTYNPLEGQAMCQACPPHTEQNAVGGTALVGCECVSGYWAGGQNGDCIACPTGATCDGHDQNPYPQQGYWGDPDHPTKFFRCQRKEHCRGGPEFECGANRAGTMCERCQDGYFLFGFECYVCPEREAGRAVLTFGGIMCIVWVWILLNNRVAQQYDGIDLLLLYAQVAGMISRFKLSWPDSVWPMIQGMLALNFDVDYLSPTCVFHDWSYKSGVVVQLILPLAYLAFLYINNQIGVYRGRPSDLPNIRYKLYSYLDVVYHTLTIKCIEPFVCEPLADGREVLAFGPEVECWSPEHIFLFTLGIIGILTYTLGFPILVGYMLHRGYSNDALRSPAFLSEFGFMYSRYESGFLYWHFCLMARRLLFCFVMVFAHNSPLMQSGLALLLVTASLGFHYYARPFLEPEVDLIESSSLYSLIVYIYCGVLFHRWDHPTTVSVILIGSVAVTCTINFGFCFKNFLKISTRRRLGYQMLTVAKDSKHSRNSIIIHTKAAGVPDAAQRLVRTIRLRPLTNWVSSSPTPNELRLFLEVSSVVSDKISDTSNTSVYSTSIEGDFYRSVITAHNTYIIDWLLRASPAQVAHYRAMLASQLEFYRSHRGNMPFGSLIMHTDLPSVLSCIVDAKEEHRVLIARLMRLMAQFNSGTFVEVVQRRFRQLWLQEGRGRPRKGSGNRGNGCSGDAGGGMDPCDPSMGDQRSPSGPFFAFADDDDASPLPSFPRDSSPDASDTVDSDEIESGSLLREVELTKQQRGSANASRGNGVAHPSEGVVVSINPFHSQAKVHDDGSGSRGELSPVVGVDIIEVPGSPTLRPAVPHVRSDAAMRLEGESPRASRALVAVNGRLVDGRPGSPLPSRSRRQLASPNNSGSGSFFIHI